jgi:cytochrome c oxidase assembly factor CtaG
MRQKRNDRDGIIYSRLLMRLREPHSQPVIRVRAFTGGVECLIITACDDVDLLLLFYVCVVFLISFIPFAQILRRVH